MSQKSPLHLDQVARMGKGKLECFVTKNGKGNCQTRVRQTLGKTIYFSLPGALDKYVHDLVDNEILKIFNKRPNS